MVKLIGEEGLLKGLELSFEEGQEWVLGRDPDECQITLEDPSVSRKHGICRKTPEGITLENLSSTNPIKINDEEFEEATLLRHGDVVQIGSVLYRFYSKTDASVTNVGKEKEKMQIEEEAEERQDSIFEEEGEEPIEIAKIEFEPADTGRFLLKVISGPNNGAQFSMQQDTSYVIGTDPSTSDIVFHDASVSRQHARVAITEEGKVVIEDLKSRNGTHLESGPVTERKQIEPNIIINVGTTSFVIFDREEDRQTIIAPLMPMIVKTLRSEEEMEKKEPGEEEVEIKEEAPEKALNMIGGFILLGILAGVFIIVGIGATTLFQTGEVEQTIVDAKKELQRVLAPYIPQVQYTFNKTTGRLLLVGHVTSAGDKNQLQYELRSLPFIRTVDDSGVIIDEYVWQETNQVIGKNPKWRGVALQSPQPGRFVLTGYLQTREEGEDLSDYMTQNFPYLDLLEKKVIVEEELVGKINVALEREGLRNIDVRVSNGAVTISGQISFDRAADVAKTIDSIRDLNGVRSVRNLVVELEAEEAVINVTDLYEVSGSSNLGGGTINVVVNGKILSRGDVLDGMRVISIRPNVILLEKEGTKYRIDYNK